jgi:hypothetical protein
MNKEGKLADVKKTRKLFDSVFKNADEKNKYNIKSKYKLNNQFLNSKDPEASND